MEHVNGVLQDDGKYLEKLLLEIIEIFIDFGYETLWFNINSCKYSICDVAKSVNMFSGSEKFLKFYILCTYFTYIFLFISSIWA